MANNENQIRFSGWRTPAAISLLFALVFLGCALGEERQFDADAGADGDVPVTWDGPTPVCPAVLHFAAVVTVDGAEPSELTLDARLDEGEWVPCIDYLTTPPWDCGRKMVGSVTIRARAKDGREVRDTRVYTGNYCGPSLPPLELNLVLPAL